MRKLFILLCVITIATSAAAQRWTIWYGVNYSGEMKSFEPLYTWRFANIGVDYTIPVSRWDFTAGAGLNTKGGYTRVNYAQMEGNVGFRIIDSPKGFRVSALVGPCFGIRVADNWNQLPDYWETNRTIFGWQAGLLMKYKFISLKVGYEQSLSGYWAPDVFDKLAKHSLIGYPVMRTSKPQALFIRLGISL